MWALCNLVLADDHPTFRFGLQQVIATDVSWKIIGEADAGTQALELIRALCPTVAILDVEMPGCDGFAVVEKIQAERLPVETILRTHLTDEHSFNAALNQGVRSYVLKASVLPEIIQSIKQVAAGHEYVSPMLAPYLMRHHRRATELSQQKPTVEQFTSTEHHILQLIAHYQTSRQIADALCLSPRTVEYHREHICKKLSLTGPHALLHFAVEHQAEL